MFIKHPCVAFLLALSIVGCATGNQNYLPPVEPRPAAKSVIVPHSKDDTWQRLITGVASTFFVINNMDKDTGFINLSYSGDPEIYVDAGELTYTVSNLRGKRTYTFPASRANAQFEMVRGTNLYGVHRTLDLEGRINVLLHEESPTETSVTVNVRYILSLHATFNPVSGSSSTYNETISFNSGQPGTSDAGTKFWPNGQLEQSILDLVRDASE